MKRNAWKVCEEAVLRIDDAPGPGRHDFLKAFTTPSKGIMLFSDKDYLNEYVHKTKSQKTTVPGHGYYSKIEKFIDDHFHVGELIIEYIKKSYTEAPPPLIDYERSLSTICYSVERMT